MLSASFVLILASQNKSACDDHANVGICYFIILEQLACMYKKLGATCTLTRDSCYAVDHEAAVRVLSSSYQVAAPTYGLSSYFGILNAFLVRWDRRTKFCSEDETE